VKIEIIESILKLSKEDEAKLQAALNKSEASKT
jgi:hypothetical protein